MLRWESWNQKKKLEGDKSTPSGIFRLGDLYLRKDRIRINKTKLKKINIKKIWDGAMTQNLKNTIKL